MQKGRGNRGIYWETGMWGTSRAKRAASGLHEKANWGVADKWIDRWRDEAWTEHSGHVVQRFPTIKKKRRTER